jgi:hypothetical protein
MDRYWLLTSSLQENWLVRPANRSRLVCFHEQLPAEKPPRAGATLPSVMANPIARGAGVNPPCQNSPDEPIEPRGTGRTIILIPTGIRVWNAAK